MSKSDAQEARDLTALSQWWGAALRLSSAYSANATTLVLEQGIPLAVMPNNVALLIAGTTYIVTTGGTFSATGTLSVTITANATAQSTHAAVSNALYTAMLTPATGPTAIVLEAGSGSNFTEATYTGNSGGTYARQPFVMTAEAGSGVDTTTGQSYVGNAATITFPTYGSGYSPNLTVQDICLFLCSQAGTGDTEVYYADSFEPVAIAPGGTPTFAASTAYNVGLTIVEQ